MSVREVRAPSPSLFWSFAVSRLGVATILFWCFPLTVLVLAPFSFDSSTQDQDAPLHFVALLATLASVPVFMSARHPKAPRKRAKADAFLVMVFSFATTCALAIGIAAAARRIPVFGDTGAILLWVFLGSGTGFGAMRASYARTDRSVAQAPGSPSIAP